MITVNALGEACPMPVVKTKKAIDALTAPETVQVLVDNDAAVQNLIRLAGQYGFSVRAEKQGEPPEGKACHEGHHHKDQQEHQRVAHIAGNNKVQSRYPQRMTAHIEGGGKGPQIPFCR